MRVFVTGATGYIGGAVARALLKRGHQVTALVRGDGSRAPLGSDALAGTLQRPSEWLGVAVQHDAIVHCAFDNEGVATQGYSAVCQRDAEMTAALAEAARRAGRTRVMVITATFSFVIGQPGTPDEYAPTDRVVDCEKARLEGEARFLATAAPGFRACSVRPAWVYGGRGGVLELVADKGAPFVVEDGAAEVALVPLHDLARLYVFLVEHEGCSGVFHGTPDGDVATWRKVAQRLCDAMHCNKAIRRMPLAEARERFGFLTEFLATTMRARSSRTREAGFEWEGPALMQDFDRYWRELING
eukprot:m51a1_g7627 hypothetical protein (301) ;mRNA; f:312619-313782